MSSSKNGEQEAASLSMMMRWPRDVGILAIEVYFPSQYVCQSELEKFDAASTGKYTIGLGQSKMGFCVDNEDINSICMTVVSNLLEKYDVRADEIGRLEVGTETLIDKAKSVKSVLMQLFGEENTDIEGVDAVNACFGGTAALFNAINWIESSYWDGRYALVVMGDLALYAKGPARPTGGAGAIALLVGPDAPLVFERGLRATHITHAYDFYKPVMDSEYPLVDGQLSVVCYMNALEKCYNIYKSKYRHQQQQQHLTTTKINSYSNNNNSNHHNNNNNNHHNHVNGIEGAEKKLKTSSGVQNGCDGDADDDADLRFTLASADAFLFHSPYCKLVQKSFARLFWSDYLEAEANDNNNHQHHHHHHLSNGSASGDYVKIFDKFKMLSKEASFVDKELEKELMRASEPLFKKKTAPTLLFAKEVGNMYTPSLYACLASYLISKDKEALKNKRIVLFSYGSGLASAMFSLRVTSGSCSSTEAKLDRIVATLRRHRDDLEHRRVQIEPDLYDRYLQEREVSNKRVPREPRFSTASLRPGTWHLTGVDERYRRTYDRVPPAGQFDVTRAADSLNSLLKI